MWFMQKEQKEKYSIKEEHLQTGNVSKWDMQVAYAVELKHTHIQHSKNLFCISILYLFLFSLKLFLSPTHPYAPW